MDKLQLQQSCFENIKSLCSNYKKDGESRKTLDYLTTRISSLENQWKDFEERNSELTREIDDETVPYFADDIYYKTKQLYESTKTDMERRLKKLTEELKQVRFDLTGTLDEDAGDEFVTLLSKQECNFKAIDRALSKINIKTIKEKWELEDHLNILKTKWDAIDRLHWELEAKLKGTNQQYYDMFNGIEDKYDNMKRSLNSKIWTTVHYEKSTPKIEIPEFTGQYHQWISFKVKR